MQLGQRQRDGRPLRDHLLAAQRGGYSHPLLQAPHLPPGGVELWELYLRISRASRQGLNEQPTLAPSQVLAWQQLHGVRLSPWELDTLDAIEQAAIAHHASQAQAATAQRGEADHNTDD